MSLTRFDTRPYDAAMSIRLIGVCVLIAFGVLSFAGCDPTAPAEPAVNKDADSDATLRVVSLAPSLSQMMVDLGAGDLLVGVAEHDNAAPPGLPVVGNYAAVSIERLVSLKPTHVLTMAGPSGPPASLLDLMAEGVFELEWYKYPKSVADIRWILHHEHTSGDEHPALGRVLDVEERAKALSERIGQQLAAIREQTDAYLKETGQKRPRVLMVIGTDPIMASGPGTVLDELLSYAGGTNAAAEAQVSAPEYGREGLLALSPEVVLFLQPKAPPIMEDDPRLAPFRDLPIPAIESGRVYALGHPLILLPSTSVVVTCAEMAKAIHPAIADQIDEIVFASDGGRDE